MFVDSGVAVSCRARVFGFVLFAALAAHVLTLLDFHSEQDQCSFGPVSNERYRELLAQAERIQHREWPLVIWSGDTLQRLLNEQFQRMTRETASTYEKIATMHAILRGAGAEYLYTVPSNNAFSQVADQGGSLSFGYQLNVDRLALFYPRYRGPLGLAAQQSGARIAPTYAGLVAPVGRLQPIGQALARAS